MANYYEPGEYTATITAHTFTPGQYGVQLVITIDPNVEGMMYPRTVYLPFLDADENPDKNIEKTIATLKHIGYSENPSRLDAASENPVSLVGNEIAVRCVYNKDGKERWYISTPQEPREPCTKQTLRKLDALFGKQLKSAVNKAPAAGTPSNPAGKAATKPAAPPVDANAEFQEAAGDDCPF